MICGHYEKVWTRALRKADSPLRSKATGVYRAVETWVKVEPARRDPGECACGCGDRWQCWSTVNRRRVLGQGRMW